MLYKSSQDFALPYKMTLPHHLVQSLRSKPFCQRNAWVCIES